MTEINKGTGPQKLSSGRVKESSFTWRQKGKKKTINLEQLYVNTYKWHMFDMFKKCSIKTYVFDLEGTYIKWKALPLDKRRKIGEVTVMKFSEFVNYPKKVKHAHSELTAYYEKKTGITYKAKNQERYFNNQSTFSSREIPESRPVVISNVYTGKLSSKKRLLGFREKCLRESEKVALAIKRLANRHSPTFRRAMEEETQPGPSGHASGSRLAAKQPIGRARASIY